jgi:hypothetical protein
MMALKAAFQVLSKELQLLAVLRRLSASADFEMSSSVAGAVPKQTLDQELVVSQWR